jgi:hypothetical protein
MRVLRQRGDARERESERERAREQMHQWHLRERERERERERRWHCCRTEAAREERPVLAHTAAPRSHVVSSEARMWCHVTVLHYLQLVKRSKYMTK